MTMKLYGAQVNASGGFQRTWGVYASSPQEALEKLNNGDSDYIYDDILNTDCQYEDSISIDEIEEMEESDFDVRQKEAPQSSWDTLRKFSYKWYCPKSIRKAIQDISYI